MSTATHGKDLGTEPVAKAVQGDQIVPMFGVGWEGYTEVCQLKGERPAPRLIYLDGDLFFMSPSHVHEFSQNRLGRFVETVAEELAIPHRPAGSTTFRREKAQAGVEGDETYYFANAPRVRNKQEIDLQTDPPPDLAIEVVHGNEADRAIEVYRRLGVPEVWIWRDMALLILVRQADGRYAESKTSMVFPFLTAAEIAEWIGRPEGETELDWIIALRRWVRDVLVPRARGQAPELPNP